MKSFLAIAALLLLAACGTDASDGVATDPDDPASSPTADPTSPPTTPPATPIPSPQPPSGPVGSRLLVMVIGPAAGPVKVCFGAVAESAPPQCDGVPLDGWSWERTGRGMFEEQGGVRYGGFQVDGTWDGARFAVVSAIPAALWDTAPGPPTDVPSPATSYSDDELGDIAARLAKDLPGAQGSSVLDGRVTADVVWDDGTLQKWADQEYGAGVVTITSALQVAAPLE